MHHRVTKISPDTLRLFHAEIENERHGGVSPATLESALDSINQGYDPRIDDTDEWDVEVVAAEIEKLIDVVGADAFLEQIISRV
tara:strand:+ start:10835 stop:11086 length:252 start_codon:yes stop_codon:yes gene_type:complete